MNSRNIISGVVVVLIVVSAGCVGGSTTDTSEPHTTTQTLTTQTTGNTNTVLVVTVVDGDTVDVRLSNGSVERVRLLGVDTPETYSESNPDEFENVPDDESGRACLRTHGEQATTYTTQQLLNENVELVFDESAGERGYYGRLLAYVYVDGENFNYKLVENGYARVYDSEFEQSQQFYSAEQAAIQNSTGVWSCAS